MLKEVVFVVVVVVVVVVLIFKLHNIVLVLPNIEMNPPQVYMFALQCVGFRHIAT